MSPIRLILLGLLVLGLVLRFVPRWATDVVFVLAVFLILLLLLLEKL